MLFQYAQFPSLSDSRDKLCRDFFLVKCFIYLIVFITCCHLHVTLKSHLGLEQQPCILDHATVLVAVNPSFIMLF